jgi:hypothetical protein
MEWKSRQWPKHNELHLHNEIVEEMARQQAVLFDHDRLPRVFDDVEPEDFADVSQAIERRTSVYDEDDEDDEEPGDEDDQPEF